MQIDAKEMPKGVYTRTLRPYNFCRYGKKREDFSKGLEVRCIHHGLHGNWGFYEKSRNLICKFCQSDRQQRYNFIHPFAKFITWSKARCTKNGKEFNLTESYIAQLYLNQDGKCALSEIELNEDNMSLDRINSSLGYIENNVQWVDFDINRMKTDLPQDIFIDLCQSVAYSAAKKKKK